MSDDERFEAELRRAVRMDRTTTVLAAIVAAFSAITTVWAGAHDRRGDALVWLLATAVTTVLARWTPPLITIRETEETD